MTNTGADVEIDLMNYMAEPLRLVSDALGGMMSFLHNVTCQQATKS